MGWDFEGEEGTLMGSVKFILIYFTWFEFVMASRYTIVKACINKERFTGGRGNLNG